MSGFPQIHHKNPAKELIENTPWDERGHSVYVHGTNILVFFRATSAELTITEQHNINIMLGLPYGTQ